MKLIKKQILLLSGATGITSYNFNILLTADIKDMGIFDTLDDTEMVGQVKYANHTTGYTFVNSYNFLNYSEVPAFIYPYNVSGGSSSRLSELEKYVISSNPSVKYVGGGSLTVDGLHAFSITPTGSTFIYYLGGIQFTDVLPSGSTATSTTFILTITGFSTANFDNKRIIKLEEKQNLVENTQLSKDVFIIRQEQSVFERNYRLRAVNGLNNVSSYAGGNYFTIFNNA